MAAKDAKMSPQNPIGSTKRKHRLAVVFVTRGRPEILGAVVEEMHKQTRPADHIFVVGSQASDITHTRAIAGKVTVTVGRVGTCHQRNDALAMIGDDYDSVAFFDDDFVPSRFWLERMEEIFETNPDVVGMSGTILDDGTTTAGIPLADAIAMVEQKDNSGAARSEIAKRFPYGSNVGCNMAYRISALNGLKFDENLPKYGWHEDSDIRCQVEKKGYFAKSNDLWGVHLGHKHGRLSGVMLGYSQIANSLYLAKKGTVPKFYLTRLMAKNLASNTLRSFAPEPYVDRLGRLKGNCLALSDLVRGKMHPNRINEM